MKQITNDVEFKQSLQSLNFSQQRVLGAGFVKQVMNLCADDRLKRVIDIAADENATQDDLATALKSAKSITFDCHTRCGAEGNWTEQAGYFVARAAIATVTPEPQSKSGGPAWQAAMSTRMALTSAQIDKDSTELTDNEWQYKLLSDFLNS